VDDVDVSRHVFCVRALGSPYYIDTKKVCAQEHDRRRQPEHDKKGEMAMIAER
jgi:hypothetical protein